MFADIDFEGSSANAEKSKAFATNPAYRAVAIRVDTTDPESVQAMVDFTIKEFGQISYSINSAGVRPLLFLPPLPSHIASRLLTELRQYKVGATSLKPTSDVDIDNFDRTIAVNAKGTMLCIRAVSKAMSTQEPILYKGRHGDERNLGRGCIVNLGSALSYVAGPNMMAYTASKHALIGITKVAGKFIFTTTLRCCVANLLLALDNAKHQIRVNALCPSWVATPMLQRSIGRWPGLEKVIKGASPAGRPAVPEEVANIAVFLCSPSASYVNGTGLLIDAGMLVTSTHS